MNMLHKKTTEVFILLAVLLGCRPETSENAEGKRRITDMSGRAVVVPAIIDRVFCADMTTTILLYSLSPEVLIGTNDKPDAENKKYVTEAFYNLPALGRIFTGRSGINEEELIRLKPDILLCPVFRFSGKTDLEDFERTARRIGIPAVMVNLEMENLGDTYLFLGKLLGVKDKSEQLSAYCDRTLQLASKAKKKINSSVRFYIAEGDNGLFTVPAGSAHSQILDMLGIINCADVDESYGYSDIQINMEQLICWNPQYVLLSNRGGTINKNSLLKDRSWKVLDAVKNGRIISVPDKPFNWIGRPPGINRLIGIYWLAHLMDPGLLEQDIIEEAIDFYEMFYHVELEPTDLEMILK